MSNYIDNSSVDSVLHVSVKLKNKTHLVTNGQIILKTEDFTNTT